MTYANVEGRNLALLTNTVGAWMQWFESLFTVMLPRPRVVTLDPESLLRTSVATLFNTAQVGVSSQILTKNEGRAMVGYGPVEGGDKFKEPAAPGGDEGGEDDGEPAADS